MSMIRQFHTYRYFSLKKIHTRTVLKSRASICFKEDEHNCKHIFSVTESLKKDATLMYMYLLL